MGYTELKLTVCLHLLNSFLMVMSCDGYHRVQCNDVTFNDVTTIEPLSMLCLSAYLKE